MTSRMVVQLSAISLERCPRSAWNEAFRVVHAARQRRVGNPVLQAVLLPSMVRLAALSTAAASLATNAAAVGKAGLPARELSSLHGCRQACGLARRRDSPLSAIVCEPCSSRSMIASAIVGSASH